MFGMVLNTPLGLCKTLKLIWNEWVPKSWRKLCISSIWILQEIPYVGIPKISEATVCKCSTKQSFLKITQKFTVMHLHRSLFFDLQPATLLKKRRRHTYFSVNFAKLFRNNFITEKLLRIGFERRILRRMANRHSYYEEIL